MTAMFLQQQKEKKNKLQVTAQPEGSNNVSSVDDSSSASTGLGDSAEGRATSHDKKKKGKKDKVKAVEASPKMLSKPRVMDSDSGDDRYISKKRQSNSREEQSPKKGKERKKKAKKLRSKQVE